PALPPSFPTRRSSDLNTHEYCLPTLLGNMETTVPYEILEIEPGEEMKTLNTAAQLWEVLAEFEADRNAVLINLGGGVITDLGGLDRKSTRLNSSHVKI